MSSAPALQREPKVGGPVDPQENLYISRCADQEFLDLLRAGEYVNIITSRQMGKTSMVYRAIAELAPQGVRFAYFDLSRLRNEPQARRYFRSLLDEIALELGLDLDLTPFWAQGEAKANGQLVVEFFRLVLGALAGPVVVVLDEIDSTLESAQLDYTDDLFTAIRSLYTLRPREPLFKRLSFCLVGVATPNELIKARRTTPYNIGRTLWLADFDARRDDLAPLAGILADDAAQAQPLLARVLHWAGGQPYLTMWMCDELRRRGARDPAAADELVEQTFVSLERLRGDAHFDQTQRFLNERAGGGADELDLYERILRGAREADQPANPTYSHLKLAGLVRRDEDGVLVVRNRIYARLFDLDWVARSRPKRELRQARRLALAAVAVLVLGVAGFAIYYQTTVAPLKQQEQARNALKDLGVEVEAFDDHRGRTVVRVGGRPGGRDEQALLRDAVSYLSGINAGEPGKGLSLNLAATSISDLTPLSGLKNLRSLNISSTEVPDLAALAGLAALEELNLSHTTVASLAPLSGLSLLEALDASSTQVVDLRPLAQIKSLQRLDLSHTPVQDLAPLAGLLQLQYLNVGWTKVTNLAPLDSLSALRTLEIDGLAIKAPSAGGENPGLQVYGAAEEHKPAATRKAGQTFRDCEQCPEMVVVPGGRFEMGSPETEKGRIDAEGPQHTVDIQPFALGRTAVTVGEFRRFVEETRYTTEAERNSGQGIFVWDAKENTAVLRKGKSWRDPGFAQDDRHPVVGVSWRDAQAYLKWLNRKTGKSYRLPSEAEREYATRARTGTARFWGDDPDQACRYGNVGDKQIKAKYPNWPFEIHNCDDGYTDTSPVGSFEPNAFGLYDMIGNVWEWAQDCWNDTYKGAPVDGRPWENALCGRRVVRGGSWNDFPGDARSAIRLGFEPGDRYFFLGFRLARTL